MQVDKQLLSRYEDIKEVPQTISCNSNERESFLRKISDSWIVHGEYDWNQMNAAVFGNQEVLSEIIQIQKIITSNYQEYVKHKFTSSLCPNLYFYKMFSNRCPFKLAALDKAFNFRLTKSTPNNTFSNKLRESELFYCADIGCGSGGYTTYVCMRRGFYNTKSFGISLSNEDVFSGTDQMWPFFLDYYYDGIGDFLDTKTRDGYANFVSKGTRTKGVHLAITDAVSASKIGTPREFSDMKLLIAQILLALRVLRDGGNSVLLWFSSISLNSAGVFFLLYNAFEEVCIHKPFPSIETNAEKYFVCFNYNKKIGDRVVQHLQKVLDDWEEGKDLKQCVPLSVIEADLQFNAYLHTMNDKFLTKRLFFNRVWLSKIPVRQKNAAFITMHWGINTLYTVKPSFAQRTYQQCFMNLYESCRRAKADSSLNSNAPSNFFEHDFKFLSSHGFLVISVAMQASGHWDPVKDVWEEYAYVGLPPGTILLAKKLKVPQTYLVYDCGLLAFDLVSYERREKRESALKKFLLAIRPTMGKFYYYNYTYKPLIPVTLWHVDE